jgi:hypothetical protein
MVLLKDFPSFSTLCIDALEQFEAVGNCKGSMFNTIVCYEAPWLDARDEGPHEEYSPTSRACGDELSRHYETADTPSLSSYLHPSLPTRMQNHNRNDSATTVLPPDDEIFRSRRASLGSNSLYFTFCKLHRCTAFSQDSGENAHPLKEDYGRFDAPVEVVHWDELLQDPVDMGKM